MTTLEPYKDVLGLIGIEDVAFSSPTIEARYVSDLNAVLQRIYAIAPAWWSEREAGDVLRAPTVISGATVSNGSRSITIPGVADWMAGCTVVINGDQWQNELVTTTALVRPYMGASGSAAITIYHDAILLAQEVVSVTKPVFLRGERRELVPLRSRTDTRAFCSVGDNVDVRSPLGYLVDHGGIAAGVHLKRLRVAPLPDRSYILGWREKLQAPRIPALSYLVDSTVTYYAVPIPQEYTESILLPILRMQFSTWKNFEADGATIKALKEQGTEALQTLARLGVQPLRATQIAVSPNW